MLTLCWEKKNDMICIAKGKRKVLFILVFISLFFCNVFFFPLVQDIVLLHEEERRELERATMKMTQLVRRGFGKDLLLTCSFR